MAVLSDVDVLEAIAKGLLRITNFTEANLTPNGYDVTIAEVLIPSTGERATRGSLIVAPSTRFAVSTVEVFELGSEICADLWIRTTWARRGVVGSFGKVDAGFRGSLTLGAYNASHESLEVPIGDRFAQVVFASLSSPAKRGYEARSGHYQDQRGIKLK